MPEVLNENEIKSNVPTSDLQEQAGGAAEDLDEFAALNAEIDARSTVESPSVHQLPRAPFVFTRVGRKNGIMPEGSTPFDAIYAALNPTEVAFNIGLREVLEKCGGGEVKHSFEASDERREDLGRYIDEIRVPITMTTGNALPLRLSNGTIRIPEGLNTFYSILELILEDPRILSDGRSNDLIVIYNSVVIPRMVLEGKVDPVGIGWVTSAVEPTAINGIQFTMSVKRTQPRITNAAGLRAKFESSTFGTGRRNDVPPISGRTSQG